MRTRGAGNNGGSVRPREFGDGEYPLPLPWLFGKCTSCGASLGLHLPKLEALQEQQRTAIFYTLITQVA